MQMATQSLTKNSEIQRVRREIARVHTFLTEKRESERQMTEAAQGRRTKRASSPGAS